MRSVSTILHRWFGLTIAAFIIFSGLTGAIISWDHAIDEWLNSEFFDVKTQGENKPILELVRLAEQRDPRIEVIYFELVPEAGKSAYLYAEPKIDPATNKRFVVDYDQIYLDPHTGEEMGKRKFGAPWPITKTNFTSWMLKFHYTLHFPEFWGTDKWGIWLLGVIAVIWTVDCFVGFYLTLPPRKRTSIVRPAAVARELGKGFWTRWWPAWKIKTRGSAYRINFDIHRAFGLWTWSLLFIVAFTAFSLNLYREVFSPIMQTVSNYTPSVFETRKPVGLDERITPKFSFQEIIERANEEGKRRGWPEPVGAISYQARYGIYQPRFFFPGADDHGGGGVGPARLHYDGVTGEVVGQRVPWSGSAADIFAQAQFPLHSGRILGLPGRILISAMGLVSAALAVTGVVIWWRKRRARVLRSSQGAYASALRSLPAE
ncbi:PepSY domain-containing protein [Bradyrhizobium sp. CCGB01]|uniref:PepSY-associated TM helix domain-containing protein n=1 Tax=Bradyrhizobium sp. CCGB01 TaxID=2949634 RepID=UPI0020B2C8CD|nr:PepSY domain-containing protein [Bradyrhizobium sp. CCGB01]MCP3404391.1 PepSY domain-containing protein [Bradyrhizobium sp. CCGB01]